ncbi:DUF4917 family protein [Shewanella vesiculosa]|uniref:DUF4917 family protein n=1 Tax=Shewanella vesiculosa TaxID=518738 RepID=UPI003850BB36
MAKVKQWEEIKGDFEAGSLILGNGASMAVSNSFGYDSLFEEASKLKHISEPVQKVFDSFGVTDFELVLRRLWQAKKVNEALDIEVAIVDKSYQKVRKALIATVRDTHVSYQEAEEHLEHIYLFMKPFKKVVSLNYDLIVYWAAMLGNNQIRHETGSFSWFKDCFNFDRVFSDWRERDGTLFFYPHGNLVLRRHEFSGAKKITAGNSEHLLDSILDEWVRKDLAPAFVCEGTRESKEQSISSCDYLEKVFYEVLPNLEQNLVIYGWAMAEQDAHLIEQISKSKPEKVAVSVYQNDEVFIGRVEKQLKGIGVNKVIFFDSESAGAWNQPSTDYIKTKKDEADALEKALNKVLKKATH